MQIRMCHADRLGYKYLWQTDDDSWVVQPMHFNLVAHMREGGLWLASQNIRRDEVYVTKGAHALTVTCIVPNGTGVIWCEYVLPRNLLTSHLPS